MSIDYKGGKIVWDNSHNWEKNEDYYAYDQDILQVVYGENCIIDVGDYDNGNGDRQFCILVIDITRPADDDYNPWNDPIASVPCKDKADMLVQLQRAIDIYPSMIKKE